MERKKKKKEIELLTPKQNGTVEDEEKKNPSMIRGMWRKAFKTLKSSPSVEKLAKKSSFHKKKQNSKEADEEVEQINPGPIDPVYSLLKCAADLPRSGGKSPCSQHAHCTGQHPATYSRYPSGGDSSGNTSKTSSPSSSANCIGRLGGPAFENFVLGPGPIISSQDSAHLSLQHDSSTNEHPAVACSLPLCTCSHNDCNVDLTTLYSKIQHVSPKTETDENAPPSFKGYVRSESMID